ncbi:hypothetical protein GH714_043544 [Hevea brasiliensis]|uniref:Uncharacterized protein n=1 Tax=Hevea brasiliensis TaxID=3981 RepID=A0A6A6K321_HEVBR|nr:hypothetical protein GH714_043544 [Hevea brasiliensis]
MECGHLRVYPPLDLEVSMETQPPYQPKYVMLNSNHSTNLRPLPRGETFLGTIQAILPEIPRYNVDRFDVNAFNVQQDFSLHTEFVVTVKSDNPNQHIGFQYGKDSSVVATKNPKEMTSMMRSNTCGWAANLLLMVELRKRILTFRDVIDLPPCDGSGPIHELVMDTVEDLYHLYPKVVNGNLTRETEDVSLYQELHHLYDALKAIGDSWVKNHKWISTSGYKTNDSMEDGTLEQLSQKVLAKLNNIIDIARKMFDVMEEDEKNNGGIIQDSTTGDSLRESYSTRKIPGLLQILRQHSLLQFLFLRNLVEKEDVLPAKVSNIEPKDSKNSYNFPNIPSSDSNMMSDAKGSAAVSNPPPLAVSSPAPIMLPDIHLPPVNPPSNGTPAPPLVPPSVGLARVSPIPMPPAKGATPPPPLLHLVWQRHRSQGKIPN